MKTKQLNRGGWPTSQSIRTLMVVFFAILACQFSVQAQLPSTINSDWEIIWRDEFDGSNSGLDQKWNFQNGPSGHILSGRYRDKVTTNQGKLEISYKYENPKRNGQSYSSGNMWSKQQFGYGYYECRFKYAGAKGTNNSFWLMVQDWTTVKPPGRGFELDINEGNYEAVVKTNIHAFDQGFTNRTQNSKPFYYSGDFSKEYHTYGFKWSQTEFVWYMDGKEIRRLANNHAFGLSPVRLSGAVVDWQGPVDPWAVNGKKMVVDYVRVWKKTGNSGGSRADANIANGTYFIQNPNGSIKLNSPSGRSINKANTTANSAKWQITKVGSYYTIKNLRNNEYLEVPYAACTRNATTQNPNLNLGTYTSTSGNHQRWSITKVDSDIFLQPLHCNKVVDRNGSNAVHLWEYSRTNGNQNWRIVSTSGSTPPPSGGSTVVVDNGQSGYSESGAWNASGLKGYNNSSTRWSNAAGAYAQWNPNLSSAGSYKVEIYKVVWSGSDNNANVTIKHSGGTASKNVNYTTGSSGWVDLGTYSFAAGTGSYVRNTRRGGTARGDAVRFTPVSTGTPNATSRIRIDNGQSGYSESGTWNASGLKGFNNSSTRWSSAAGAYAQWTPTIPSKAKYDVYIYKVVWAGSDNNAKIDIKHSGGTTTKNINYQTGSSGWVKLGTFTFNSGTGGYVRNTRRGGNARADAVSFTPPGSSARLGELDSEASLSDIYVYPNPTSNEFSIDLSQFAPNDALVKIHGLKGEVVYSTVAGNGILSLNKSMLNTQSNGMYLLRITELSTGQANMKRLILK